MFKFLLNVFFLWFVSLFETLFRFANSGLFCDSHDFIFQTKILPYSTFINHVFKMFEKNEDLGQEMHSEATEIEAR